MLIDKNININIVNIHKLFLFIIIINNKNGLCSNSFKKPLHYDRC